MLSTEEKSIFKVAYEEAAGKTHLIAQVGSLNLNEAKELAKYVTDLGYPSILEGVDNKLIIYSIPALTGVALSLDQFAELFENPKIVGIKYTNADFYLLERVRNRFPDKLILSGFDEMLLPALALDVDGAIGSTFNLNAPRVKEEIAAFEAGDIEKARELQTLSNDYITDLLNNDLYPTIKLVFEKLGVHAGYCKEPMSKPTPEMEAGAQKIYEKYFKE